MCEAVVGGPVDAVGGASVVALAGRIAGDAIRAAGYGAVRRGQGTWNGVAILARDAEPILIRDTLPGDPDDEQSRSIEVAIDGVLIASLFLPNGNP